MMYKIIAQDQSVIIINHEKTTFPQSLHNWVSCTCILIIIAPWSVRNQLESTDEWKETFPHYIRYILYNISLYNIRVWIYSVCMCYMHINACYSVPAIKARLLRNALANNCFPSYKRVFDTMRLSTANKCTIKQQGGGRGRAETDVYV